MTNEQTKSVPKHFLAFLFPQGFNEFWTKCQFKQDLEQIIYDYIPATENTEEIKKTLAGGVYGLLARTIANTYDKILFGKSLVEPRNTLHEKPKLIQELIKLVAISKKI